MPIDEPCDEISIIIHITAGFEIDRKRIAEDMDGTVANISTDTDMEAEWEYMD